MKYKRNAKVFPPHWALGNLIITSRLIVVVSRETEYYLLEDFICSTIPPQSVMLFRSSVHPYRFKPHKISLLNFRLRRSLPSYGLRHTLEYDHILTMSCLRFTLKPMVFLVELALGKFCLYLTTYDPRFLYYVLIQLRFRQFESFYLLVPTFLWKRAVPR